MCMGVSFLRGHPKMIGFPFENPQKMGTTEKRQTHTHLCNHVRTKTQ